MTNKGLNERKERNKLNREWARVQVKSKTNSKDRLNVIYHVRVRGSKKLDGWSGVTLQFKGYL